jgi:hypothetical protein
MAIYRVFVIREYVVGAKDKEEAEVQAQKAMIDEMLELKVDKKFNVSRWVENNFGFVCDEEEIEIDEIEDDE